MKKGVRAQRLGDRYWLTDKGEAAVAKIRGECCYGGPVKPSICSDCKFKPKP